MGAASQPIFSPDEQLQPELLFPPPQREQDTVHRLGNRKRSFVCFVLCLVTILTCTVSVHAAANLVVTSVSGPAQAPLNETISITYTVKNTGDTTSGAHEVGLYLSQDKTIDPATDRLLKSVAFPAGLAAGKSKKATAKVIIPNYYFDGLSGKYYYGAVVDSSAKASSKQVAIVRFQDNGDGTVTDNKMNRIWQKDDDGSKRNWSDAQAYCENLVLGEHNDWVVPSIEELLSIADFSRIFPGLDPVFGWHSGEYWTRTSRMDVATMAWVVFSDCGTIYGAPKQYSFYVRCVRIGP
jgi:hypothetical protein